MKVKELKRLIGYFNDDLDVVVEDKLTGFRVEIKDVTGRQSVTGLFQVRIETREVESIADTSND